MRKYLGVVGIALFAVCSLARAEFVFKIAANEDIKAVSEGAKVLFYVKGDRSTVESALEKSGYVVAKKPADFKDKKYSMMIENFELSILEGDKTRTIKYEDLNADENRNVIVPTALKSGVDKAGSDEQMKIASKTTRSALDLDAGVIHEGAKLAGSNAGGVVVGVLASLVGMAVDSAASKMDAPPAGVVRLKAMVHNTAAKEQRQYFILAVASTKDETPKALFDAAIQKYVELTKTGYKAPMKAETAKTK